MSFKRHSHTIPAIAISASLVAVCLLWTARAEAMDRFVRSSAPETSQPDSTPATAPESQTVQVPETNQIQPTPPPVINPPDNVGLLNWPRQFALGMIETGNEDSAVGGLGEVSRYQIMPSVWKHYSDSRSYRNSDVSLEVARQHWTALYDYFKKKTDREPTNFDMYVLWNTRYGYYANRDFTPARLAPVVRDRAERFNNLVEDGARREAALTLASSRS